MVTSPLLSFQGALSLGRGGWFALVSVGEAGCSVPLGHWSPTPGREEERKEVADPLGLWTCLMDDLERICLQGGMAGFALETLMSSVVPRRFFKN